MDLQLLIEVLVLSGITSVAAVKFLGQKLVEHQLAKDLAAHKEQIELRLNRAKSDYDATLRKDVETYLAQQNVDRNYVQEARRRLYLAVGPLRVQLLLACLEYTDRIHGVSTGRTYDFSMDRYFGRSTAYRLLRLLGVTELIERKIAIADFSVDADIVDLLLFKRRLIACLCDGAITLDHSNQNWDEQVEHLFKDTANSLASAIITQDARDADQRVKRYEEFTAELGDGVARLRYDALQRLLTGFNPQAKPLLWIRLLAINEVCRKLLELQGAQLRLAARPMELREAVLRSRDAQIASDMQKYLSAIERSSELAR